MMEGSASEEILGFMKTLSEKFGALRADVERERRFSASQCGDSSESDADSDSHRPQSRQWKKEKSRSRQNRKGKAAQTNQSVALPEPEQG